MAGAVGSNTLRALRHRNFQLFFTGQVISVTGTWMESVAQAWLVYRLTGSAALLGLVSFSGQIPILVLSAIGGYAADRRNRHRVVIATQTASMLLALALAALTLTGRVQIWEIFVMAALLGVVNAFDIPARQSFLVEMVGRSDLMNAIALNSSMFNGARIIGPAIAGVLVAAIGEGWCFFVNGVSYIAVIAGLLMMQVNPFRPAPRDAVGIRDDSGGISLRRPHSADSRHRDADRGGELRRDAIYGADANFRRPRSAYGRAGTGAADGATGVGALGGALMLATRTRLKGFTLLVPSAAAVFACAIAGFAASGVMWLSCVLLLGGGVRHDGAGGGVEYADSVDGARPSARTDDERVFDDVSRDRAVRGDGGRLCGGEIRGIHHAVRGGGDQSGVRPQGLRCGCPRSGRLRGSLSVSARR